MLLQMVLFHSFLWLSNILLGPIVFLVTLYQPSSHQFRQLEKASFATRESYHDNTRKKKAKFLVLGLPKSRSKYEMKKIWKNMKSSKSIVPYHISFPSPTHHHPIHTHAHIPFRNRSKLPDWSKGRRERQRGCVNRVQFTGLRD